MCYKIKRIFVICLSLVITLSFTLNASALDKGERQWYLKRRGGSNISFPQEAEKFKDYNAYYLDKDAFDGGKKVLYLTFDAGYENGNVEKILDTLRDKDVPAAFFILDNIILKNTDLVTRMAKEGHLVCNHTKDHKNLSSATKDEIKRNLCALDMIYKEKTGCEMAKYFRFPEGKYSLSALDTVNKLGYKTVFWSFAYDDWDNNRQPNEKKAIKKVLDNTHDGAVILLHPTSKVNASILPELIDRWREMGYTFGTLDELTK